MRTTSLRVFLLGLCTLIPQGCGPFTTVGLKPSLIESTLQTSYSGSACDSGQACPGRAYPSPPPYSGVMVGYSDQQFACENGVTCSEEYVISRGLVQFDLTPLNGHSPVSAILLFRMTQASTPNSTVLASIGTGTQPPPANGQGLAPMNPLLTLPTGSGL